MTQKNQIVLIVVGCMVTGFIAVAVFLAPAKNPPVPFVQNDLRPIPQQGFMTNPRKEGGRKALTIIQTHRTHLEWIQGHIWSILLLSGQSDARIESLQYFQWELSWELKKLYDIEAAIITRSKSPREIKKFMDELRPSMKQMMWELKEELRQNNTIAKARNF